MASSRKARNRDMKVLREALKKDALTKTGRQIAEFVLDHFSEACFMTSTDIAVKLNVSESSVIRFSRSLGYSGFMDFQKELRKSYHEEVVKLSSNITIPSERLIRSMEKREETDVVEDHYRITLDNLQSVLQNNPRVTFEKAAQRIVESRRKYIVASRANTCVADYMLLLLKHMLPDVTATNYGAVNVIDHMCDITEEDCVILFSFPRYSEIDRAAVEMAYEAGAPVIVFTDKSSAKLAQYADILLLMDVDSNTFFNSYVGVQFAMELLCAKISAKIGCSNEDKLKKIDRFIGGLGIY